MFLKAGTNFIKAGNNVLQNGENLVLKFVGASFPIPVSTSAFTYIQLVFNTATKVTINYGNGVSIYYSSVYSSGAYYFYMYQKGSVNTNTPPSYGIPYYTYPDGLATANRTVSINYNRGALISFTMYGIVLNNQDLLFGFSRYNNLKTFNVAQCGPTGSGFVNNIDLSNITTLTAIDTVAINSFFASTSAYYGSIPSFLFSMPLAYLAVGDNVMAYKTFSASGLANVYLLASTLLSFILQGVPLVDNNYGLGDLPSNWNSLTKLTTLTLNSCAHTILPPTINTITSITYLTYGFNNSITSWGNMSALVNLTNIVLYANINISPTVPSWLTSTIKLKQIILQRCYLTSARIDAFVSSFYSLVIANAPITGVYANLLRNMNMAIGEITTGDGTAIPSGIYQQPAGYVSGSNNGTPASSLEMIWVMVHQYAHSWTYRTV